MIRNTQIDFLKIDHFFCIDIVLMLLSGTRTCVESFNDDTGANRYRFFTLKTSCVVAWALRPITELQTLAIDRYRVEAFEIAKPVPTIFETHTTVGH